jgi:rubrerythrin
MSIRILGTIANRIQIALNARFLDRLVATPDGRAYLMNALTDAEEADEQGVFDRLVADVTDPQLNKVVRTHRDDETRHGQLMTACLARNGYARDKQPDELRIVPYIARALGDGDGESYLAGRSGVFEAYLFLQVLEERAVAMYPRFAAAIRPHDPQTADVILAIAKDEERHVKYARAVSRRYAPDGATLASKLARFRVAEATAFAAHGRATIRHVLRARLLDVSIPERAMWRAIAA